MTGVKFASALVVLLAAGEGWTLNVKPASTRSFTNWKQRLGDRPYYIGPTKKFSNGDKHVHGAQVWVLGRQTCNNNAASYHCNKRLIVRFPHNDLSSAILESELSMHHPSKKHVQTHKAVLSTKLSKAANFLQLVAEPKTWRARLGTNPYFIGKTQEFSNGDRHVHGERVAVLGRQTCRNNVASYHCDKRLIVRFPGNDLTSALLEDELSKHMPKEKQERGHAHKALASRRKRRHVGLLEEAQDKPIANPWRARFGTNPYYIGKNETFSNGDEHVYGERVSVLGRQTCGNNIAEYHCDKRLVVRFPGNELTSALLEDDLSKHMPHAR